MTREWFRQWMVAILVAATVFAALSLYLFVRRGYYTLYIANKAFGSTGLIVIGIVLLLGPLSRLYQRFDRWIAYRKELGIVGFTAALTHSLTSLFFLPDRFPLAGYMTTGLIPFLFGFSSILLLTALTVLSVDRVMTKVNREVWWRLQFVGVRAASTFAFLHLVIMKYQGWTSWFVKGGASDLARPFLPPGSLFAGSFGVFVLLVRLVELVDDHVANVIIPVLLFFLMVFWLESFLWGMARL